MTDCDTKTIDGVTETFEKDAELEERAAEKPQATESAPRFPVGTVISERALVVDIFGKSWWVDPLKRTCELLLDTKRD